MPATRLSFTDDLPPVALAAVIALVVVTFVLLTIELLRRGSGARLVWVTGILSTIALAAAVLRPTWITESGIEAPARIVVLVDGSHRLALPGDDPGRSRAQVADGALEALQRHWSHARFEVLEFGDDVLVERGTSSRVLVHSDLSLALRQLLLTPGEKPQAVVVISDGRLDSPGSPSGAEDPTALERELRPLSQGVPIHTIRVAEKYPSDSSIRVVGTTGTALAHQPFRLDIEVGCEPQEDCAEAEVVVSELLEGREPRPLSRGLAERKGDELRLSLEVTLERAGARIIEVALTESQDGLPHNDRRLLPIDVRRDRTRLLHVAGRPTYDVRALRQFLKADESIDLISFFILRTEEDDVHAPQDELALIPFPVDELFTEHLPSFDAIILQDIDARRYKLDRHFTSIKRYVLSGGGLIMVGGPSAFSGGGYADSPIEDVLPIELSLPDEAPKLAPFVPKYTVAGRAAPILWGLRELLLDALPEMTGYNPLGPPKKHAMVLWEHPEERATGRSSRMSMPLLAVSEIGDGRSIALSVDGTQKLRFGRLGATVAGQAHGALWEGLLGWLMRDPRFEAARPRLDGPCISGFPTRLRVSTLPGAEQPVELAVTPLSGDPEAPARELKPVRQAGQEFFFDLPNLPPGGYAARIRVGPAPPTRFVFACEEGGEAHADSRPDAPRLTGISAATGGMSVTPSDIQQLPSPQARFISTKRASRPVAPSWAWTTFAAFLLGVHWLVRRASGLS